MASIGKESRVSCLVTVPVYNEAAVLERSIKELSIFLTSTWKDKNISWAILIADNGSRDETGDIAKTIASEDPRVRHLCVSERGRGGAFREAVASCDASYYLFIDVDLPVELRDINKIIAPVKNGTADLVVGKRLGDRTWHRKIMTRGWSFLMKTFFGIALSDAQCGIFAVNARGGKMIAECRENGWFLNSELIIRAAEAGLRMVEIPVFWIENRFPKRRSKVSNPLMEIIKGVCFFGRMMFRFGKDFSRRLAAVIGAGVLLGTLFAANALAAYGKGYGMLWGVLPSDVRTAVLELVLYFFVLYMVAKQAEGPRWRIMLFVVIAFFALYFLITLPMAPDRSQDIYWNLLLVRGFSHFHLNPYSTTPAMLPLDAWSAPIMAWMNLTMVQGPLWVFSLLLPSLLGQPFAAIVVLKILFFAVVCFSLWIFWKVLGQLDVPLEKRPVYFMFLLWNPFFFQEIFIDLHADVFILATIILAFYFFLEDKGVASIIVLVIGGFFKYAPWLLVPIPMLWSFGGTLLPPGVMLRRISAVAVSLAAGFALFYLPFGGPAVGLVGFFHQTLDIFNAQDALLGTDLLRNILGSQFLLDGIGVLLFYITLIILIKEKKMAESFSLPFIALFFFGTSWFMPWYFLWILPLLVVIFSPGVFVITCALLMLMPDIMQPFVASVLAVDAVLIFFAYKLFNLFIFRAATQVPPFS